MADKMCDDEFPLKDFNPPKFDKDWNKTDVPPYTFYITHEQAAANWVEMSTRIDGRDGKVGYGDDLFFEFQKRFAERFEWQNEFLCITRESFDYDDFVYGWDQDMEISKRSIFGIDY